jgi:putative flippase GtrA
LSATPPGGGLSRQIIAFASVGVAATIVHYLSALVAALWLPIAFANPVGFVLAFFVSYLGHAQFTFQLKGEARRHRQRLPRFIVTASAGFLMGHMILLTVTRITAAPDWVALAIAVGSVPVITFALSKLWVFRNVA